MLISVDGLDKSGKTTAAQILSELTGFEYLKVKKGSLLNYLEHENEEETTRKIIYEISSLVPERDVILDRNYFSALITGKIYDPSLDISKLLKEIPKNIASPNLGLIIKTSQTTALSRVTQDMTIQDRKVLASNYDDYQGLLISLGTFRGFQVLVNDSCQIIELRTSLEKVVSKHFF